MRFFSGNKKTVNRELSVHILKNMAIFKIIGVCVVIFFPETDSYLGFDENEMEMAKCCLYHIGMIGSFSKLCIFPRIKNAQNPTKRPLEDPGKCTMC